MIDILICVILVCIDFFTKLAAVKYLMPVGDVPVIDGFFHFTYVKNQGAAFGSMQGGRWFFIILTAAVLVAAIYYYIRNKQKNGFVFRASILLICSGAAGNFIDRLFKGYVVDFLNFYIFGYDFPVFNFADICVVAGAFLFIAYTFWQEKNDKPAEVK